MAKQQFYVGSVGPLLYDDTETYPDAEPRVAFRGPQILLDDAPTEDAHVMRKEDTEIYVIDTIVTYIQAYLGDVVSYNDEAVFFDDNLVYNI